jgi:hypothetical protein
MIKHALRYLNLGLSLVPARGKVPLVRWIDFQNSPPDEDKVRSWWSRWPDANIAIVCGKASGNLVVVDIDTPEAKEKFKTLKLPLKTWIAKTNRGWHIYYRTETPVMPVRGIYEIKSQGGVVIAPPSTHPSGQKYQWLKGYSPDDCKIAIIDPALLRIPIDYSNNNHTTDYVSAYKGTTQGLRNTTLAKLTGSWFRLGMTLEEAIETAMTWNKLNSPPLPEKEVITTVKSIWKRELYEKKMLQAYTKKLAQTIKVDANIPVQIARKISVYDILLSQKGGIQ